MLCTQTTVQHCLIPLNLKQSPSSSSNADPTNSNSVLAFTFCFQESVWLRWRHGLLKWKNPQESFMTTASLLPHVKTWGMEKTEWDEPLMPSVKWQTTFHQEIKPKRERISSQSWSRWGWKTAKSLCCLAPFFSFESAFLKLQFWHQLVAKRA